MNFFHKESKVPRGGARPGAGRKKGQISKKSAALQARVAAEGITPLEVMLKTMRAAWNENNRELACSIAKDAAPYIHPRLMTSKNETEVTHRYVARAPAPAPSEDAWQQQHQPAPMIQ